MSEKKIRKNEALLWFGGWTSKIGNIIYKNNIAMLILFLAGTGAALVIEPVVTLLKNYYICLAPFALFGIMLTAFNIQFMSYVQIVVDENYLGRVFSIIFTVAVLFMPIGSFAFSLFINPSNVNSFYLVGGGIVVLAVIARRISTTWK